MTMQGQAPGEAATTQADSVGGSHTDRYTGVIIIHGIGDIKRNATLQEAVDALTYWFNHEAGLALRPEGPGRVWLTAALTDDDNPDAPAARATIELEPPPALAGPAAMPAEAPVLRLEWREVWWAESFGLPSVGATITWARIQAREQARHLLVPIGRKLGPAKTATRAPARETPQALTYRPTGDGARSPSARAPSGSRVRRTLLQSLLWVYDLMQYIWKGLQWLLLTPLVLLLLLVMGVLRVLALIPFLRSTVIAGISTVFSYIMLHWIASLQVYMLDYTRASAIRERFEREVNDFLRDERCERIVVLAHSMGTVVAYEGLTTALAQPDIQGSQKPITFICLAQALRRIWLLSTADPHRVRSVLPDRVRWLHFWARYDPVATGPLSARTLPVLDTWPDPEVPNPYRALTARLDRCENVDVVNTDSIFTDHTTYWQNLEQVVGPIARELVAGHPALEQVVQAHVATPDKVLQRRWSVAWRSTLAIWSGIAAAVALLVADAQFNLGVGAKILAFLESKTFQKWVIALLTGNPPIVNCVGSVCNTGLPQHLNPVDSVIKAAQAILLTAEQSVTAILLVAAALLLMGVFILAVGRIIALPSPFALRPGVGRRDGVRRGVIILAVSATGLFLVDYYLNRTYGGLLRSDYPNLNFVDIVAVWLGAFVSGLAWLLSLSSTIRGRRWGWSAGIVLATIVFAVLLRTTAPAFSLLASTVTAVYAVTLIYVILAGPGQPQMRTKP
jgi:Alpha/beta hydrolase of unknown function (DUF900)